MSQGSPQDQARAQALQKALNVKFSAEDLQVLNECGKESFFKRCLPFSSILGLATYAGIKAGYLRQSPRWGVIPKVAGAVFIGYFLGKLSYRSVCAQKLMQLPNSEVGRLLRESSNPSLYKQSDGLNDLPLFSTPSGESTRTNTDNSNSSLNLDIDRPLMSLEDTFQSPISSGSANDFVPPTNPSITYDDMRKQNRESHSIARSQPYKIEEPAQPKVQTEREKKNKYGDVIN